MIRKLFLTLSLFLLFFLVAAPVAVHAQDWTASGCIDPNTGIATLQCLPVVFSNIVRAALIFVGSVAVILIVYAGILLVRSGGDQKQVGQARQIITYAIIGLVLVLLSFAIIYFIGYITGATCIETISFTSCK